MVPKVGNGAENLLVPVAVSASHIGFNAVRLEPNWMILGQSAGVAAAMAVAAKGRRRSSSSSGAGSASVHDVNVTELRERLRELGQYVEPASVPPSPAPSPPSPTPSAPLTGRQWYAWKKMWALQPHNASMTATENEAVLKRTYGPSKSLPPSEVRYFDANASVALQAGGGGVVLASDPTYWLVTLAETME